LKGLNGELLKKEEEKDGLRMKKMVVMEVLWWLWRLEELVKVVLVVVKSC
jgi:hypothetical protein